MNAPKLVKTDKKKRKRDGNNWVDTERFFKIADKVDVNGKSLDLEKLFVRHDM